MKKIFALLMTCMLLLATGCGGDDKTSDNKEPVKVGTIKYLNVTENLFDNYLEKTAARMQQEVEVRPTKHIFFDNMSSMLAALQAKQIDSMSTYYNVAEYLLAQDADKYKIVTEGIPKLSDSFCCAMLEKNSALKKEFDDAISKMKSNGTLANLVKTYITEADLKNLPTVDVPNNPDAQTIKVAVTGDVPPLDYIHADGKPAGFNTAFLAEISKLIGKNIEFVDIDSGARAAALTSEQVDVVFWAAVPLDDTIVPADFDKPEGVILTEPYFSAEIVHVQTKK